MDNRTVRAPSDSLQELYRDYLLSRRAFGERLCDVLRTRVRGASWASATLLDIGCGEGLIAEAFAARGARVVGLDADSLRLRKTARRIASEPEAPRVAFVHANAHRLPFASSVFDVALLSDVLEHLKNPQVILAEVARILKPGGVAYIATTNRWSLVTTLIDPHYNVPGVNLMPQRVAIWYVTRLMRVSPDYDVEHYFSKPGLRRLISAAGLRGEELRGLYEDKIRSGNLAKAPGRQWLTAALRTPWLQRAAIGFARTWFFNIFVQPGFEFLAFRAIPPHGESREGRT